VRSVVPIVCVAGGVCSGDFVIFLSRTPRNSSQDSEVGRNPGLTEVLESVPTASARVSLCKIYYVSEPAKPVVHQ